MNTKYDASSQDNYRTVSMVKVWAGAYINTRPTLTAHTLEH